MSVYDGMHVITYLAVIVGARDAHQGKESLLLHQLPVFCII